MIKTLKAGIALAAVSLMYLIGAATKRNIESELAIFGIAVVSVTLFAILFTGVFQEDEKS